MLKLEPYLEGPHCRRLQPPNPAWPQMAAAVIDVLTAALTVPHELHHIGSTSVPGLLAKPMIDLLLVVDRAGWPEGLALLEQAGLHRKDTRSDLPDKPVRACSFLWGGERINVNVHLTSPAARACRELLWFRDRLRADPELVAGYAAVKREAYKDGLLAPAAYNDVKWPFIQRVLTELTSGD